MIFLTGYFAIKFYHEILFFIIKYSNYDKFFLNLKRRKGKKNERKMKKKEQTRIELNVVG